MKTLVPDDELLRVEALHQCNILNTPPEEAYDEIAKLASQASGCPIAIINFVGGNRTWAKASVGLKLTETSRDHSFCAHAILQPEIFIVPDAQKDPRFSSSPLVADKPGIRFYAGVPLLSQGHAIGTLCVMDLLPRDWNAAKSGTLEILARQTARFLELRRLSANLPGAFGSLEEIQLLQSIIAAIRESPDLNSAILSVLRQVCQHKGWAFGEAWIFNPKNQALESSPVWHATQDGFEELRAGREALTFVAGKEIPGSVLSTGEAAWIRDVTTEESFTNKKEAKAAGVKTACAIPVLSPHGLMAVIELFGTDKREPDPRFLALMSIVADQLYWTFRQRQTQEALQESEERYVLAEQITTEGLWDWNLKTRQIHFSPRWKAMLGYEDDEIGANPEEWFKRVHPQDMNRVMAEINMHLEGAAPKLQSEHRLLHKFGTYRWILCRGIAVRDAQQKAYRMTGSITDINERKIAEEQLMHDALYDPLTQLPNRALFVDRLSTSLARAKRRSDYSFAVIFLDLDRFKVVNESLGHGIGDQLLVAVARRLENCLRPGDTVARLGGDDFAMLLDDMKDPGDVNAIPDRILKDLSHPFNLSGQEVFTTVSLGIAVYNKDYRRPDDMLRDADTAMYRAKTLGRGRYELFDSSMHAGAVMLMELESDLRKAIDRQEFQVYYQPIVSLKTGKIEGSEALLRWWHPERGLIAPGEFIALAEETRLIETIGEWIMKSACSQNKQWRDSGFPHLRLAVNFSALQFEHPNLTEIIKSVLRETKLPAEAFEVEITESTAMRDVERTIRILAQLKKMGVGISLDDFGTGYSSLGSLSELPISRLKINQAFLKNLETDSHESAIAKAIISLAHSLKVKVVAEGVETEEQLNFLLKEKCDELQGYLFSPPISGTHFTKLIEEGKKLRLG